MRTDYRKDTMKTEHWVYLGGFVGVLLTIPAAFFPEAWMWSGVYGLAGFVTCYFLATSRSCILASRRSERAGRRYHFRIGVLMPFLALFLASLFWFVEFTFPEAQGVSHARLVSIGQGAILAVPLLGAPIWAYLEG